MRVAKHDQPGPQPAGRVRVNSTGTQFTSRQGDKAMLSKLNIRKARAKIQFLLGGQGTPSATKAPAARPGGGPPAPKLVCCSRLSTMPRCRSTNAPNSSRHWLFNAACLNTIATNLAYSIATWVSLCLPSLPKRIAGTRDFRSSKGSSANSR